MERRMEHTEAALPARSSGRTLPLAVSLVDQARPGDVVRYHQCWEAPITVDAAHYRLIVRDDRGKRSSPIGVSVRSAPDWGQVEELVPGVAQLLADGRSAMAFVESTSDLAMVSFTRHAATGTWSAEHFISAPVATSDGLIWPAGC